MNKLQSVKKAMMKPRFARNITQIRGNKGFTIGETR